MNLKTENSSVPADHLLTCISLAIEEARQSRTFVEFHNNEKQLETAKSYSDRLLRLNREIDYLEAKLIQIRCSHEFNG